MTRFLPWAVLVLAFLGLGVSSYSRAHKEAFISGSFCTINETFNCDLVNRGEYSDVFGVPVALIGIIGYGLLALAAVLHVKYPTDRGISAFLLLSSFGGLGFSGYLTSLEAFVLKAWCLLCLTSQILILGIFVAALWMWFHPRASTKQV